MGYKPIYITLDKFHGIIFSNETIFDILVYLGMANNVSFGCFQTACIKYPFSIFKCKSCVQITQNTFKKWDRPTHEGSRTYLMHNLQVGCL